MVRLRHIDPQGHVDSPLLGRQGHPDDKTDDDGQALEGADRHGHGCLEPGEILELPEKVAHALLEQIGNWELADKLAKKAAAKRTPRKRAAKRAAAPEPTEQDGEQK